jgi:hypothetical protein
MLPKIEIPSASYNWITNQIQLDHKSDRPKRIVEILGAAVASVFVNHVTIQIQ